MRKVYQKLAYTIMIAAFTWLVIGDLVNMHMKIIYKKDLCAHNTLFTKTVSKDKSSFKIFAKKINPTNTTLGFISSNSSIQSFLPFTEYKLYEDIYSNIISPYTLTTKLRGPPSF